MRVLRKRLDAILVRLISNEALDREQQRRGLDHERRIQALERKVGKRVKTLDADE
jgi:hypothetical protein